MNVARPYEIFSHRLDVEALVVLARTTQPLSARHVWRLAREGSEPGIRLALQRQAVHGLVTSRPAGRAHLYALNRGHLAASLVEQLASLRSALFERMRAAIAAWEIEPIHASIFGSTARGDGDTTSDIDLFLIRRGDISEEDHQWRAQVDGLVAEVYDWTGNEVGLAELAEQDARRLRTSRSGIAKELRSDAIDLAGVPARRLLQGR